MDELQTDVELSLAALPQPSVLLQPGKVVLSRIFQFCSGLMRRGGQQTPST